MSYTMKEDDVFGLASAIGADVRQRGRELNFRRCPYCEGGGHDNYTFSINLDTGAFKCFRSGCGKEGHFVQLARDYHYRLEFDDQPKQYKKLPQVCPEPTDGAIKYLAGRGIPAEIAKRYNITTRRDAANIMALPFYDDHGVLTFVKYRKMDFIKGRDKDKEFCEKGAKPILFGMDKCTDDHSRLVVTEGQIDCLSLAAAGIENAVSVPMGATNFAWVNHCHEWVERFDKIVIFGDCEKGHVTLVDLFIKHFGHKKIYVVRQEDYLGEKDANDILRRYGAAALTTCVDNAEEVPVLHVRRLADVESIDLERQEHIRTGLYTLDKVIGGLYMGTVTVLTGRRGEGKSTLASQIVANALDQYDPAGQPYSVFVYSGELPNYHFKRWLDLQLAGNEHIETRHNEFGDETYTLTYGTVEVINSWYHDRAYIYDSTMADAADLAASESLITTMENEVRRHNVKLVLIDNLMMAVDADPETDLYRAQSRFVQAVKCLAMKYNIAVLLIAHPRKSSSDRLTNDDISGSGDITNRVDTVLTYARDENKPEIGHIGVTKNRLTGNLAEKIEVTYGRKSKRIGCNENEWKRVYGCFKEQPDDNEEPF